MHLEAVGFGEQFATGMTLVLTDARVFSGVSFQTGGVVERSITVFAFVRFLARVPPPVLPQCT